MSDTQPEQQPEAAGAAPAGDSLLDQVLSQTAYDTPEQAKDVITELVKQCTSGLVKWDKNTMRTVERAIEQIDQKVSIQLAAIMHTPEFQKLEGTWRGLSHLVFNSETGKSLKIRALNVSKKELHKDLANASEFDQSKTFKKMYENEFGQAGGEPFGAMIGDFEFSKHPDDIETLELMSSVAAAAFCPFISAASPKLFGFEDFTELSGPRDLGTIFEDLEYTKWNSLRESDDSRFTTLVMPRVLSRLPYGAATNPSEGFNFEEVELGKDGKPKAIPHDHYAWMNAAYVMGAKLTEAYAKNGWCTAIRGVENGGKVEGLPAHVFTTDDGDTDLKCPTEVAITDRREGELGRLGFLPLAHFARTDYSVFFGAQTLQQPKDYGPRNTNATENAQISARLPYVMATSRIAHFLKVIARDKIGAFMEASDCQDFLTNWIKDYICVDSNPSAEMKAKFPLAEARIEVEEIPGSAGSYQAVAHLRPWLQMEELTTSLRMVARIPAKK